MKKAMLRVDECEVRLAPAVAIDAGHEAYAWVLINELREDPAGFAAQVQGLVNGTVPAAFGFSRNDPVVTDLKTMISSATSPGNYSASLNLMRSTPSAGPLAWADVPESRAEIHTDWMKANGFAHTGSTGLRQAIPGFSKNDTARTDEWGPDAPEITAWGENIAWAVGALRTSKLAYNTGKVSLAGLQQRAAFLDTLGYMLELNSGSLGHLKNLLSRDDGTMGAVPGFNSVGIDTDLFQAPNGYETQDGVPEAWISTHRFGMTRSGGSGGFVAGVAFEDHNGNDYYDVGEGSTFTIDIRDASGNGVTVTTDRHGAYSEFVPNGTYTVTFASGGSVIGSQTVVVNNNNAAASWAAGEVPVPTPAPAPAPAPESEPVAQPPAPAPEPEPVPSFAPTAVPEPAPVVEAPTPAPEPVPTVAEPIPAPMTVKEPLLPGNSPVAAVGTPRGYAPYRTEPDIRPDFSWSGVIGASRYEIRVDDLTGHLKDLFPTATSTSTTWEAPSDLASGRAYQWQVRAIGDGGPGEWSVPRTFMVGKPVLTGTSHTVTSLRPTFTWNWVGAVTAYEIRVNDLTTGVPGQFLARVYSPSWTPSIDLVSGRTYTWQVRAVNALGQGRWSPAEMVTVGRPVLSGPADETWNRRPTLTWTGIGGAPAYEVRFGDQTTGQTLYLRTTGSLDWTPPADLTPGHTYWWQVRAINADGLGRWSPVDTFRVV